MHAAHACISRCLVLRDDGRRAYKGAKFKFEIETAAAGATYYILYFVATSTLYSTKRYEVQYRNQSMNVYFSPVVVGLFRVIAYHQANLLNPLVCEVLCIIGAVVDSVSVLFEALVIKLSLFCSRIVQKFSKT